MDLPAALLEADRDLAAIVGRVRLAEHLNPVNIPEARAAWLDGAHTPPLRYAPVPWAGSVLAALGRLRPPLDHPLGDVLARSAHELGLFVVALRDRTAEAFHTLALANRWYPDTIEPPGLLPPTAASYQPARMTADEMVRVLQGALDDRGHRAWLVRLDPVLSSRVLVDAPRREVRVNPRAVFRASDAVSLVAHEIDVHVERSVGGDAQPLQIFRTGLPGALATEEGLAIVAEEHVGVSTTHVRGRQALVAAAILMARNTGFREVHDMLAARVGPDAAWTITVRVKRGLADPGAPGVFAKDAVYHTGHAAVRAWLDGGGDLADLYVGKVGLDDPVREWIAAGWVFPGRPPALWTRPFSRPG